MAAEKADQARERELMAIEEIRCCVPPISKPPAVRFLKASHNCVWVEWNPVEKNSNGDLLTHEGLDKVTINSIIFPLHFLLYIVYILTSHVN